METLKDLGVALVFVAVILGITAVLVYGLAMGIKQPQCLASYENYSPEFGFWEGCRIMVDGELTPVDIVRKMK